MANSNNNSNNNNATDPPLNNVPTFDSNAQCRYQRGGALVVSHLTVSHAHRLLFQQPPTAQATTASLSHGVITGLVGVNGAGKSSLARLLASKELPGFPRDLSVTYVTTSIGAEEEENTHVAQMTPEAYIWSKVEERIGGIQGEIDLLEEQLEQVQDPEQMEEISEQLANLYDVQDTVSNEAKHAMTVAMAQVGLQAHAHKPIAALSSGWRYKCRLIAAFITHTDLLIIDEPSFLDAKSMEWFVNQMHHTAKHQNAMVLLVSHKENLLNQLCTRIWYINAGNQTLTTYNCGYSAFRATHDAQVQRASHLVANAQDKVQQADKALSAVKAQLHKREKNLHAKTQQNADQRFIKGKNKEAKQKADKSAAAKVKQLERQAQEMQDYQQQAKREMVRPLRIEGTISSERVVVQLSDVGMAYNNSGLPDDEDKEFIFRYVDSCIEPTDRILLTGDNGCGKSTLLKLMAGRLAQPTEGNVHLYAQQNLLYFPQTALSDLTIQHGSQSAMDLIVNTATDNENATTTATTSWTETRVRHHLGNFDLKGDLALRPIATLSAGQRVRLWLAKQLVHTPHPSLLLLDEISENVDVETRRSLVDMLDAFQGAVLTVSHDVDFSQSFLYTQVWELTSHGLRIEHASS